ncbi:MAG: M28 family peptidase [Gemmatimonadaceae bacterium]|nr:M28 family peptidase [Gemmatimonadaceae bacterium]
MRLSRLASPAVLCLAAACASGAPSTPSAAPAAATSGLSVAELRRDLTVFASDSFGGRETGTPYADKAARWIAARLQEIGVEPGGDSGYFARVPMHRTVVTPGPIQVSSAGGTTTLSLGRDFAFLTSLGPGAPLPRNTVDAEVVFAGYGLVDPKLQRDDYAGLQVAGKVVVIAGAVPPGLDAEQTKALANPQSLFNRLGLAIGRQPAAVVLLLPDSTFHQAASQFAGTQIALDKGTPLAADGPRPLPMVAVGRLGSVLMPAGWPASRGALASGTRLKASYSETASRFNGYNVVGIVRGSDPALRATYVAFGAHYDHIGISAPVNGDSINNGADDDGSGSVTLLGIARAWLQGPRPKRSALFVWHVGEEKGLFGSEAFTDKPTVPLDSIVAQLNADMIGRNGTDSLYLVGPGAAPNGQSAVLGTVVDSVNAALPQPFTFNREWDTTTHPERIYYRSDHFNYARKGIPIVFFTSGLHDQYHQVTDEAALINYEKLARVGDLMLRTGIALGNRATRAKPGAGVSE